MPLPALNIDDRISELQTSLDANLPRCELPQQIFGILSTSRGDKTSDPGLLHLPYCCKQLVEIGSLQVAALRFSEARVCFRRAAAVWADAIQYFPFDFTDQVRFLLHCSQRKEYESDPNYTMTECTKSAERGYYRVTVSYHRQPHPDRTLLAILCALAADDFEQASRIALSYKLYLPSRRMNLLGVVISLVRGDDHLVQPYFATPKPVGKSSIAFPTKPREFAYGIVEGKSETLLKGCKKVNAAYEKTWATHSEPEELSYLIEWGWLFSLYAVAMLNLASKRGLVDGAEPFASDWIPKGLLVG